MTRTAMPASKLCPGDRVMGWPDSPMYVAKRPSPRLRDGKRIGWSVTFVGMNHAMQTDGDPELDVLLTHTPADGAMR